VGDKKILASGEYGAISHANIDSRQLRKFMKVPGFSQSLSAVERGKIEKRIRTAKWSTNERIVYDAVQDGYTSLDTLPVATGLTEVQVRAAVSKLTKRGYVSNVEVAAVEA